MPTLQPQDYLKRQKKKYLSRALFWGGISVCIFAIGLFYTRERATNYTLIAALFVLPFGLDMTRYLSYVRYPSPQIAVASRLEAMTGTYALYHAAVLPDTTQTFYFEHLIITPEQLYLVTPNEQTIQKATPILQTRLQAKGFIGENVHFVHIADEQALETLILEVQNHAHGDEERIACHTKRIVPMMM